MPAVKYFISALTVIGAHVAFGAITALAAPPAIVVTSTGDSIAIDGFCTLREAIGNANTGAQTNPDCAKPKGKVTRIDVTNPGGDTIILTAPRIFIDAAVEITGPGPAALTISQSGTVGHFAVRSTSLDLSGVRLVNAASTGAIVAGNFLGDPGFLTVNDVVFDNNSSSGSQGAAVSVGDGSATIFNSAFFNNSSVTSGGAISISSVSTLTIGNSIFINNTGPVGGAIVSFGSTLTVTDSVFAGNNATGGGGAIFTQASGSISSADTTITNSTFIGNVAGADGGAVVSSANNVGNTVNTTITGSTIAGNTDAGGANDVVIKGNGTNNVAIVNSIIDDCVGCP